MKDICGVFINDQILTAKEFVLYRNRAMQMAETILKIEADSSTIAVVEELAMWIYNGFVIIKGYNQSVSTPDRIPIDKEFEKFNISLELPEHRNKIFTFQYTLNTEASNTVSSRRSWIIKLDYCWELIEQVELNN